jgi:acetyl esterase/lipase
MGRNPIHPSVLDRLDPEYVTFHNANLLDHVPPELLPWDPSIRESPVVPGSSTPLEVGSIKDFSLSKIDVRVFTPKGDRPVEGWPVFIWFHGGLLKSKNEVCIEDSRPVQEVGPSAR